MVLTLLKSKIHRATVTQAEIDYVGSITIDRQLMDAAGIMEYEQVHVADIDNGNRLVTYVIAGEAGSGTICINGAGAKLVGRGDKVIIMCYCQLTRDESKDFKPTVIFVDGNNVECEKEDCK
jgi:aspartate 1-decarboxylase